MLAMGTIQTPALLTKSRKSPFQLPVVKDLESKIELRTGEMDFYHKLLSWLLFSCHEERRHVIESFRKELTDLRKGGFAAVADGLERLKNEAQQETGQPDLLSDITYLQMYFNHIDGALESLKSRIHRRFGEFTHVCIW